MAVQIGETYNLDRRQVGHNQIATIRRIIEDGRDEPIRFQCFMCGAERTSTFYDPGILSVDRALVCEESREKVPCQIPRNPPELRRISPLLPGSIVMAPPDPNRPHEKWPAVIEPDPYGREDYRILGGEPEQIKAYFVNFIYADDEIHVGGFIAPGKMHPFFPHDPSMHASQALRDALGRATCSYLFPLRARLLELSFTVFVWRYFKIGAPCPPSPIDWHLDSQCPDPQCSDRSEHVYGTGFLVPGRRAREDDSDDDDDDQPAFDPDQPGPSGYRAPGPGAFDPNTPGPSGYRAPGPGAFDPNTPGPSGYRAPGPGAFDPNTPGPSGYRASGSGAFDPNQPGPSGRRASGSGASGSGAFDPDQPGPSGYKPSGSGSSESALKKRRH